MYHIFAHLVTLQCNGTVQEDLMLSTGNRPQYISKGGLGMPRNYWGPSCNTYRYIVQKIIETLIRSMSQSIQIIYGKQVQK